MAKPVIVTRIGKGSKLTWLEGDSNFTNLQNATWNISDGVTTVSNDLNSVLNLSAGAGIQLTLNDTTKSLTITSTPQQASFTSVVQQYVQNNSGSTIAKGKAVYISGANGNNPLISLASNAAEGTSSKTLGLTTTDITQGSNGYVITEGLLEGLDTSTAQIGDPVWLGTSGNFLFGLLNKPVAPNHLVYLGAVVRVNINNGAIFVKVQNGYEIDELHNVLITSIQPNDILKYDSTAGVWKNATEYSYTLPTASTSVLGGVRVDGSTITITGGVISGTPAYTLPTSSASVLGGVKVGSGLSIDGSGVLSATYSYTLPTASTSVLGGVKVDGSSITISNGVISSTGGGGSATVGFEQNFLLMGA